MSSAAVPGLIVAAALALLFALAAAHKLAGPLVFRQVLAHYGLPPALAGVMARLLPALELGLAAALVHPATRAGATVAAATLLAAYGLAMGLAMALARRAGREFADCGCTLALSGRTQPPRWALVGRNGLLALVALLPLWLTPPAAPAGPGGGTLLNLVAVGAGIVFVCLAYAISNTLIDNHYRQQELFHD